MNDFQAMEQCIAIADKYWQNATDDDARTQWDAIRTFMKAAYGKMDELERGIK
jgi:hypothetical protein